MRILHLFDHSVPLQSGYASRSLGILNAQHNRGWQTRQATTPRHHSGAVDEEIVDGIRFERTRGFRLKTPVAREVLEIQATARRLLRMGREWRPDAIHAHSPSLNAIPALWAGRRLGVPTVYEVRAFWEDAAASAGMLREGSPAYRLFQGLETRLLHRVDGIATICEGLRSDMIRRGIPEEKIFVVPNAVDVARFAPNLQKERDLVDRLELENALVLGFIGSFYRYEGLDLLVRAMKDLETRHSKIRLLLVGGGPEEENLRRLAADLGLESVLFAGRVPHRDVQKYYSLIDIFVYPRLGMRLTDLVTPLKPLESMAMAKPVVASDVGGHRELMKHGDTGMTFAAGDVESLSSAIMQVASNPALGRSLAANGREFVKAHRSWEASVARYVPLYERLAIRPRERTLACAD